MSPISKRKIAVVGSSNTDMIIKTANIPRPGETILGGEFHMAAGGKGANQAVAAARAGGDVAFIARIGNDIFGKKAVEGFIRDGIDVKHVYKDRRAASGIALIIVGADGENSIAVASGANLHLSTEDIRRAELAISSAKILLMQLETPLETVRKAAEIAAAQGVPVILNPAPARALDDHLLSRISILTPNETETEMLTGIKIRKESDMARASQKLLNKGVRAVFITLGSKGAFVASETEKIRRIIPAFKVKAVDTTAAGDVFNGALAVALAEGRSLLDAARFANAAAALSVTKLGAQPSAPYHKDIEKLLKTM
ncbi:MAG: ribokinase [Candidatus Aminicenantes bacterium]|nr:ribokinase [Candidatus Aminicenantes bacterium]